MTTYVRTTKTRYPVTGYEAPHTGPHALVVRQPSGKKRLITVADVGRARFDGALAHFQGEQRRAAQLEEIAA